MSSGSILRPANLAGTDLPHPSWQEVEQIIRAIAARMRISLDDREDSEQEMRIHALTVARRRPDYNVPQLVRAARNRLIDVMRSEDVHAPRGLSLDALLNATERFGDDGELDAWTPSALIAPSFEPQILDLVEMAETYGRRAYEIRSRGTKSRREEVLDLLARLGYREGPVVAPEPAFYGLDGIRLI